MTTQVESGVFEEFSPVKIAEYTYDEIVTPSEIYNDYEEANQYIIDWHVWWNLGAPKLCPEIKIPLIIGALGDELPNFPELSPWGLNTPITLDLEKLLARRKPKEDLIKLGLRRKGVSPLMAENVILFLRCLDYQNRSASFIRKIDHWGLGFTVWNSTIVYTVPQALCDCVSDFRLFDPLDEIASAYIEIGGQIIKYFEKAEASDDVGVVQDKFWKLNLFCDPFPPLPILKICFQEIKIVILRNSPNIPNIPKAISLEYLNTIVNKSRRVMYLLRRIDGYGEDIRWRATGGTFALLME